jgi:hypothetical protein
VIPLPLGYVWEESLCVTKLWHEQRTSWSISSLSCARRSIAKTRWLELFPSLFCSFLSLLSDYFVHYIYKLQTWRGAKLGLHMHKPLHNLLAVCKFSVHATLPSFGLLSPLFWFHGFPSFDSLLQAFNAAWVHNGRFLIWFKCDFFLNSHLCTIENIVIV